MLSEKIKIDLKESMKNKDAFRLSVLRSLSSAMQNEEIKLKKREVGLSEEEIVQVFQRESKKRKDSISQFETGGREDLAENEKKELEIIKQYLPEQLSEEDVRQKVKEIITSHGEVLPSQFGQIMGQVMKELQGKADGNLVKNVVKQELT
jgi:uncharacterized protein